MRKSLLIVLGLIMGLGIVSAAMAAETDYVNVIVRVIANDLSVVATTHDADFGMVNVGTPAISSGLQFTNNSSSMTEKYFVFAQQNFRERGNGSDPYVGPEWVLGTVVPGANQARLSGIWAIWSTPVVVGDFAADDVITLNGPAGTESTLTQFARSNAADDGSRGFGVAPSVARNLYLLFEGPTGGDITKQMISPVIVRAASGF